MDRYKVNDSYSGWPTHVERVGELLKIYLQKDPKLGEYVANYLFENMKELSSSRYVPIKEDLHCGVIGIGEYDDNQYYRIQILDKTPVNDTVNVCFIDYGNCDNLNISDIRLVYDEAHKGLLNIPPLASYGFLENVVVPIPWNGDEFTIMKNLILYQELQCLERHLDNGIPVINLYFPIAKKKLSEIILENDLGKFVPDAEVMESMRRMSGRYGEERQVQPSQASGQSMQMYPHRYGARDNTDKTAKMDLQIQLPAPQILPVGTSYQAYISHIEDGPYNFSVQLKVYVEDSLPRLAMILMKDEPVLIKRLLPPGSMVMTKVSAGNCYKRSAVLNTTRNSCLVYHVDYGNTEEVPFTEIYELPVVASQAAPMAAKFALADLKSMQITDGMKAYFQDLLLGKPVHIKVTPQESEGPLIQYCELYYEGRNIKEILTAFNTPLEYTSQHPPRGKDIKVTVSHIHGPSLFFIQYNCKLDVIDKIQEAVQAYCKGQSPLQDLKGFTICSPVAALFEDKVWYRGMVVGVKNNRAHILYVDYGNRLEVPANWLCPISRELVTQWRSQAVECCLVGFEDDNANEASEKIIDAMEELLNHNFTMTPSHVLPGNRFVVELVDELGGKLSDKLKKIKLSEISAPGLLSPKPPVVQNQDSNSKMNNYSQIDFWSQNNYIPSRKIPSAMRNENQEPTVEARSNFYVRPSIRPIVEQKNKYSEHDDRSNDVEPESFNRQSSFERAPRTPRNDEVKPNNRFSNASEGGKFRSSEKNTFPRTPNSSTYNKPNFHKGASSVDDDFSNNSPKGAHFDQNSDTSKQSFVRTGSKKPWENEGSDKASDSIGSLDDDQRNWSPGGDRTRLSNRLGDRSDKNKWGGESERPRRDGGNRFSVSGRRNDSGDFNENKGEKRSYDEDDGNRFGNRNRDDGDSGSGRFGNRNKTDGEGAGGNRFGNRNRDEDSRGNRFGNRNRDEGESSGNRFGNRKREDGESSGNRFGNRNRDEEGGGNRFGNRNRDEEGGGNRFGNRNRDEEGGGNKFGNRNRDEEGGGNRFGNRNRDEEGGGNRFGNRKRDDGEWGGNRYGNRNREEGGDNRYGGRRREDGEGGGNRFGGKNREDGEGGGNRFGDRRRDGGGGGRFGDNQGRRDGGGRFNKDNDFKSKRFDSDSFSSPKPATTDELWDDEPAVQAAPTLKSAIISGYPAQNVSTTSEMQVAVSSVVNPQFFYVQDVASDAALEMMRSSIDNLSQNLQGVKEDCLSPGTPVLARFSEDSLLYRGTVKYLLPPNQAHILFVDYGNFETVNLTELFSIPVDLLKTPPLALHCSLHDVSPPNETWPTDCYDGFMNGDEVYTMNIVSIKMIDGEVQASAKLTCSDGVLLSQKLSDAGLAVLSGSANVLQTPDVMQQPISEEIALLSITSTETAVMPEENWISPMSILLGQQLYGELLEVVEERSFVIRLFDAKIVTLATLGDSQASSCIKTHSKYIVYVEEILEDRLKVVLFDLDGVEVHPLTDETREPLELVPVCPFPVFRSVEKAYISHSEGADIFIQRSADIDNITKLADEIFSFYNDTEAEDIDWAVGELCCAKSVIDESWYRAKIESKGTSITVRYLDYGNTEILPKENLRKLDQRFIFAEFSLKVAVHVKWVTLETSLLDILPYEEVVCKLINTNSLWIADITYSSGKRLVDILKENNIAEEANDNPFDEIILPIDFDLTVGSKMPIVVSHADSPTMFWAHKLKHIHKVDELQEKLQAVIGTAIDASESDKVFAAQYSADSVWYRATKVDEGTLRFIDYGNTDALVSPKKLPDDMIQPASGYAIPMYLCVKPVDDDWSVDAIKEFEMFIEQQNIVANIINTDYKIIVDLCEGEKCLSKILIESGKAVYCNYVPEIVKTHLKNVVPDFFTQKIQTEKSVAVNNDVNLLNQHYSDKVVSSQNTPNKSKVFVTHCDSLNDFYVQEDSKTARIDTIQSKMLNIENAEKASDIKVGGLYGVKFEDDLWYRAKVLSTEPDIKVIFIDYGNTFLSNDLRQLSEDLTSEEAMSLHCSLGVDESPEAYSKFVKSAVEEQSPLLLTVLSYDDPCIVQLEINSINILTHIGLTQNSTNIQKGKQKAFITHIYGPDCFYVQTEKQLSMLEELSVQMSAGESFGPLDRIQVGDVIAVLFEDDSCWYRGEVLTFAPEVLVRFVDYGNSAVVKEYRELPPEMKKIAFLVTMCSLKLPAGQDSWPAKISEVFATTCAMNPEAFEMEVLSSSQGNTIIELYLNGEPITETLVNMSSAIDEKTDDSSASAGEPDLQQNSTLSKLQNNKPERGYVTHINSISDFYIQKEDCADLLRHVQDSLSALENNVDEKPDCGIGSLIAAKFVDGEWYRGEILQIDPEIRVRFIDYGNECNVSEISVLPDALKQIPPVAMKCSLEVADNPLKDDAKELFHKHFCDAENVFEFIIKSVNDGVNIVEIILDGINVLSMLCIGTDVDSGKTGAEEIVQDSAADDASSELIGKVITGYISHINSVRDFYIQAESATEILQTIQLGLDDSCSSDNAPATCDVGDLIGAKFTDGCWFRGEVTTTSPKLRTRFIDHGNESDVSEISSLPQQLLDLPAVALRCSLDIANLCDSNEINTKFVKLFGDGATLLEFHILSSNKGLNVVKAVLGGEDISLKLTDVMTCTTDQDIMENDVEECAENIIEEHEVSNNETETAAYITSTENAILNGDVIKNANIQYENEEADIKDTKEGVNEQCYEENPVVQGSALGVDMQYIVHNDQEVTTRDHIESESPKVCIEDTEGLNMNGVETENLNSLISAVNSITDFYLSVKNEKFNVLNKILNDSELFDDPAGVCIGDILAGKSVENDKWFRCKVETISDGNYTALLLDYGGRINVSKFKELPSELILLEPLALHCSLYCPEDIISWPSDLTSIFCELRNEVCDYEIINTNVSPVIVKLSSPKGDISTILSEHVNNDLTKTSDRHSPISKTEDGAVTSPPETSNENTDLLKTCEQVESKECLPLTEEEKATNGTTTKVDKKQERKSLTPKPVKSLAQIKANAKARIVTRSQGSSPVDKKLLKNEVRSPSEPRIDEDHVNERLQRPLFVRTSSLDDTPVPGSMSNPSSPLLERASSSSLSPSNSLSPQQQSSPRHFIAEKIVPGSISGVIVNESQE